ncbi:uncharacterized protein C6orf118 isoform X2 [Esox lucius]|uniref:uncharacterized protein C6orf118 isoform X2 n=1 Tax=Esox lucius TaxID=8010 RepID=UPI001476EB4F|nr:uncharacterized protein C6orf118 isoform X2 [Esox lucius]
MSAKANTPSKPHRPRQELQQLLLGTEVAHKADILTYSRGHLSPNTLVQPQRKIEQPIWKMSEDRGEEDEGLSDRRPAQRLQRETEMATYTEKMKEAVFDFVVAKGLKPKVLKPGQHQCSPRGTPQGVKGQREEKRSGLTTSMVLDPSELFLVHPMRPTQPKPNGGAEQVRLDRYWFTQSYLSGLTKKDQLKKMRQFDRQVLGTRDLKDKNCMRGSKAVEKYKRKLEKELEKRWDQSWPSRERLGVFSDVLDDVCGGSSVFGDILREIKTDYDLYLISLLDSQTSLNNMPHLDALGILGAEDLEEAGNEVFRLGEEARRALDENNRVRNEFQIAQDRFMEVSDDKGLQKEATLPDLIQPGEGAVSFIDKVQPMRLQVWKVWGEVQLLETEIKEKMVSIVTTGATERCIRDSKADIIRIQASNERLRNTNKDLENNINMILNRARVSEDDKVYVFACFCISHNTWTKVHCHCLINAS